MPLLNRAPSSSPNGDRIGGSSLSGRDGLSGDGGDGSAGGGDEIQSGNLVSEALKCDTAAVLSGASTCSLCKRSPSEPSSSK